MEIITVQELMIPLEEYATVEEEATLFEVVMALERMHEIQDLEKRPYLHTSILVRDKNNRIIGKISQLDVLRALEPKYQTMGDVRTLSRAGFSPQFLKNMMENMHFCDASLTDMCGKAAKIKVKDFMYTPAEGEYVEADASLCEAIHQLVLGHHQKLLVVRDGRIVGILRLAEVFTRIFGMMRQCEME
jgi:CBS domain-containing protein